MKADQHILSPTLLIDKQRVLSNLEVMLTKANAHGLQFRPHFKTHQSLEIGRLFKEKGLEKITVSSLEMARYFAKEWEDITLAFPVNLREVEEINLLASKIQLKLCVENRASIEALEKALTNPLQLFLKMDLGYHRTGLDAKDRTRMNELMERIDHSAMMSFGGFLGHAGHSYKAKNRKEIEKIHSESLELMQELKAEYAQRYPDLICSIGDTPSCSIMDHFEGIDEIRPGNFVYYDLCQFELGSCNWGQIAVALACPVIALHPERNELLIHGGGVHFSKEYLEIDKVKIFGLLARSDGNKWGEPLAGAYVKSLSQEHGIVHLPDALLQSFSPGDLLHVLPVHSCMTANLMKEQTMFV